ncbi:glycosyltransferase [Cupriavidus sp. USMAHM13]|uniref:glycosyltransferase n=1 Tax=Cupriavidus sp. USMAHM13 TaxID=1389192 RepID=UPI000AA81785|nr:glycosyltransferase [Cupriavidus sp. USMAHM13]
MSGICLNMIVKNEAPVITRCLASVRPWIDRWVIVDTGSTDGTQDIIRDFMGGVPGELHERPWRDFAHNRNEAMALARPQADYLLFIDADETLRMDAGFRWPALDGDGYQFRCELNGWQYQRNALVSARQPWRWEGVLHEYLTQDAPHRWQNLAGAAIVVSRDGARARDSQTYLRDIEVLERALRAEPGHTRYRFYLAQSYRDAGLLQQSLQAYRERIALGGWEEECWFSRFQVAVLTERLEAPAAEVREAYLAAYQARPVRAEPLCELARYHRLRGEFALAHLYAQQAAALARPADTLFLDDAVYTWRALDELVVSAYYVGALEQGREALRRLLAGAAYPEAERARIEGNRVFYGI